MLITTMGFLLASQSSFLLASQSSAEHALPLDDPINATRVLVSYYSDSGWTKALAEEVAAAVSASPDTRVQLTRTNETSCADMLGADGIIFGSPVYMGTMASEVKALIDKIQKVGGSSSLIGFAR